MRTAPPLAAPPWSAPVAGLHRRADLLASGATVRGLRRALAGGELHQVAPGVLATAPLPRRRPWVVTDRVCDRGFVLQAQAALLSAGPRAVARGRTAASLQGLGTLVEPTDVELLVPHGRRVRQRDGVDVRTSRHPSPARTVHQPCAPGSALRVSTPLVLVAEIAHDRSVLEAVVVLDQVLRRGLADVREVRRAAADGPLAFPAGRAAVVRADARSESVLESVARVHLHDAGLHGFVPQLVLRDRNGGFACRVDLAWPVERLVVEVDGRRFHPEPGEDRARGNLLTRLGWKHLDHGWEEVVDGRFVHEVREVLGR